MGEKSLNAKFEITMRNLQKIKQQKDQRRARRTRAKLATGNRPRLAVHRSLRHLSVQLIDQSGRTLLSVSDQHLSDQKLTGLAKAQALGQLVAERVQAKKVKLVVFDKGRFKYHGQIKALAEAARQAGLKF